MVRGQENNRRSFAQRFGFTLTELILVISIIAVITAIGGVVLSSQQKEARDARRVSNVTAISEALEKYYQENGEYPGCAMLTGESAAVASEVLGGIDQSSLVTPTGSADINSLRCTDLTELSQPDIFAYVGDNSSNCQTGNACLTYTLKYKDEADSQIAAVESRHQVNIDTSGIPQVTATPVNYSHITANWSAISNALSYTIETATNAAFTANKTTNSSSTGAFTASGLAMDTTYYFRVRVESASGSGEWSSPVEAKTPKVGTPVASLSATGFSQINVSWPAINDATLYTIERATDAGYSTNRVVSTSTGTSINATGLTMNTTYYFRVRVESANNAIGAGSWSSTVQLATWNLSAPTASASTLSSTSFRASWGSVPHATSYVIQLSLDGSTWTTNWQYSTTNPSSYDFPGASQGVRYYIRMKAVNSPYESAWSNIANTVTTIDAPAAYNMNMAYMAWNNVRGSASNAVCPAGTTYMYHWYASINGANNYWVGGAQYQVVDYSAIGWNQTVSLTVATRCETAQATSNWTWANGAASRTLTGPSASAWLGAYRTAAWGGSCPDGSTSHGFYWRVHGTGSVGDTGWQGPTTATSWANTGVAWGDGTIRAFLDCNGPWGTVRSPEGYGVFGPGCVNQPWAAACYW